MDLEQLIERRLFGNDSETPFVVGKSYLIRTVTHAWTGRVDRIVGSFLELGEAAWIADTGRFTQATCEDNLSEVEPVEGPVIVNAGSIVDARTWTSPLPRTQK